MAYYSGQKRPGDSAVALVGAKRPRQELMQYSGNERSKQLVSSVRKRFGILLEAHHL